MYPGAGTTSSAPPAYWIDQTLTGGYNPGRRADGPQDCDGLGPAARSPDMLDEVGNARLSAVMELLKENETPSAAEVVEVLATPIEGFGRYRYANRKAALISEAVSQLDSDTPPDDPGRLQDYLMRLKGVGPQDSCPNREWLQWLACEGRPHLRPLSEWEHSRQRCSAPIGTRSPWDAQHQDRFVTAFLQYARHGKVSPGALDWCIRDLAREAGSGAFDPVGMKSDPSALMLLTGRGIGSRIALQGPNHCQFPDGSASSRGAGQWSVAEMTARPPRCLSRCNSPRRCPDDPGQRSTSWRKLVEANSQLIRCCTKASTYAGRAFW